MQSSPSADGSALGSDAGPAVSLRDLEFSWTRSTPVLSIERFEVARGERVFLKGPSGSGKSTLLSLISGVIGASPGSCLVLGKDLGRLSTSRRDALRAEQIGVIFQMFNLVPYLSVLDNVLLPLTFSAARRRAVRATGNPERQEAERLLASLGLGDEAIHARQPTALSVGQQQRVAAARALIGSPDLILADEPTSALDQEAQSGFVNLLLEECARRGSTLIFVSHDTRLSSVFDRVVDLSEINSARAGAERLSA